MAGLAFSTAFSFLQVEVGTEMLLYQLQAVQVFLAPKDLLLGQNKKGEMTGRKD